jgi:wobble nucleotide-excising tRNase
MVLKTVALFICSVGILISCHKSSQVVCIGEKIIFKSLFSWINDGSHFINDDLVIYAEPENIEKQLAVFKGVFKKLKHESHYNMMIGMY